MDLKKWNRIRIVVGVFIVAIVTVSLLLYVNSNENNTANAVIETSESIDDVVDRLSANEKTGKVETDAVETEEMNTEAISTEATSTEETDKASDVSDGNISNKEGTTYTIDNIQAELLVEDGIEVVQYNDKIMESGIKLNMTSIDTYNTSGEYVRTIEFYIPNFATELWTNKLTHIAFFTEGNLTCNIDFTAKVDDNYEDSYIDKLEYLGYIKTEEGLFKLEDSTIITYTYMKNIDGVFVTYSITCDALAVNENTDAELKVLRDYLKDDVIEEEQ